MLRIEIMLLSFSFFSLKNEYIYLKIIIINYKIEREKKVKKNEIKQYYVSWKYIYIKLNKQLPTKITTATTKEF